MDAMLSYATEPKVLPRSLYHALTFLWYYTWKRSPGSIPMLVPM